MNKADLLIVLLGKRARFFQKRDQYTLLTLDGLNEFSCPSPAEEIPELLTRFADKLNLESAEELSVSLLSKEGEVDVQSVRKAIEKEVRCVVREELDYIPVLANIMRDLKKDPSLEVDLFGVNYGNVNYRLSGDTIQSGPYNLLSYTVSRQLLTEYILDGGMKK